MLFGIHAVQRGDHRERVSKYENELIMDGIEHPVKIRDIDRFERLNGNISVSVFGLDEKTVFPMRITRKEKCSSSCGFIVYLQRRGKSLRPHRYESIDYQAAIKSPW